MQQEAYLGLDIGGTGAKAGLVDGKGRLLAISHRPYHPQVTDDGHIEIPIDTIYTAAREAAVAVIHESGARVVALSISSQGQTFVSLDDQDQPLHPAIVWYDARASVQAKRLAESLQALNLQGFSLCDSHRHRAEGHVDARAPSGSDGASQTIPATA